MKVQVNKTIVNTYGGRKLPGIVVSRNLKKKSAFIKIFMSTGLNKQKQLVSLKDIYYLGTDSQNESIINGDEVVRSSFLHALIEKEKSDDSL